MITNDGGLFLLLAGVVVTVMLIALLLVYVVRVVFTILLIAAAPIALMLHALPQTEGVAVWWWRAFGGVLAIQVLQSLVLATAVRVLLNDGGELTTTIFGASTTTGTGWINILVSLTLLWILWKIPFWVLGTIGGRGGGRSFLGAAARTFLAYKTFGLVRGAASNLLTRSSPPQTRDANPRSSDPYARERATPDGQLMLPLTGLRRHSRGRTPSPAWPTPTPPGRRTMRGEEAGRQLALPLAEGDWPENRPRLGPDGQYRLPLNVTRVPRPTPPPPPPRRPDPRRTGEAGAQLPLPLNDPQRHLWVGNRPLRSGQYPLPLDRVSPQPLQRRPRPAATATRPGSARRTDDAGQPGAGAAEAAAGSAARRPVPQPPPAAGRPVPAPPARAPPPPPSHSASTRTRPTGARPVTAAARAAAPATQRPGPATGATVSARTAPGVTAAG